MRLTTDQLKTGWLHPQRVVRNVVASHFAGILTTDPDVTRHAIRGAREFGWQRFLTWNHQFTSLPLADDESFEWVCGEVERAGEEAPSGDLAWHLTRMLARAEIGLVERHQSRLLALGPLRPEERQVVLTRLELATCSPDEAWRRLEDHCRMAASGETFEDARIPEAELLLEPLVRAGSESVARVMDVLSKSPRDGGGDDPTDWLTGLMMILAGRLRIEEAAPRIWDLLAVDWDWYGDVAEAALTRIGTPGVAQLIRERYPQAEWEDRLYATTILARIRCDEAAAAIEEALRDEDDDGLRAYLGVAAAAQFDARLVPLAMAVVNEDPADPERGEIRERLVAFSHLSGHDLPERDAWERDADEADDHLRRRIDRVAGPLAHRLGRPFDDDGDGFGDEDLGAWSEDDEGSAEPALERGSQVGRNEPCPCGSGKKYKRCCLPR